jgi:hypothetical protein
VVGYSAEGEHRFRREAERRSGAKVNSSRSEAEEVRRGLGVQGKGAAARSPSTGFPIVVIGYQFSNRTAGDETL